MNKTIDREKIVEGALAILSLSRHSESRVWKNFDWDLLDELHKRGWITNPATKAKSVVLTEEGIHFAEEFLEKYFGKGKGFSKTNVSAKEKFRTQEITKISHDKSHILRCTSKLLKELRIKPIEQAPEEIDQIREWHANIITVQRKKCLIITHSKSLYSFVIYGIKRRELENFNQEFSKHLLLNLFADQIDGSKLIGNKNEINLVYAKTNNRSVLGSMNDIANQIERIVSGSKEINSRLINRRLNRIPMGALNYGFPDRELKNLLK